MHSAKKFIKIACAATFAACLTCQGAFGLYAAKTTGSSVNLRATQGGSVLTSLPVNAKVAVIDNDGEWYKVAAYGMTGYIKGNYIAGLPDCDFTLGTATVTCDTSVNVRSAPGTGSEVLASVDNGGLVWVTGVKDGWYKVTVDKISGYMSPEYVYINGEMPKSMTSRNDSSDANGLRQEVLDYAASFLGTPYVYGGSTPSGFDCSGFTSYVYKNTVRSIPRTATQQRNALTNVSMDELKPADLVFFGSNGSITHVGIYAGNGQFIHSPHTGSSVKYDTLWSGNYNRRFVSGGRVIFDN